MLRKVLNIIGASVLMLLSAVLLVPPENSLDYFERFVDERKNQKVVRISELPEFDLSKKLITAEPGRNIFLPVRQEVSKEDLLPAL